MILISVDVLKICQKDAVVKLMRLLHLRTIGAIRLLTQIDSESRITTGEDGAGAKVWLIMY